MNPAVLALFAGGTGYFGFKAYKKFKAENPPTSDGLPKYDPNRQVTIKGPMIDASYQPNGTVRLKPDQNALRQNLQNQLPGPGGFQLSPAFVQNVQAGLEQRAADEIAFKQKWGFKQVWLASELVNFLNQANPTEAKFLSRFMTQTDGEAWSKSALEVGRYTIVLDSEDSIEYFTNILVLLFAASFEIKNLSTKQDLFTSPDYNNMFRLFTYHEWKVSDELAKSQLSVLERFMGMPTYARVDRGGAAPKGKSNFDYVTRSTSPSVYWADKEGWFANLANIRCTPDQYPMPFGMEKPRHGTQRGWRVDPRGTVVRSDGPKSPGDWLTENVLGENYQRAYNVVADGKLLLFEVAALRFQNMCFVAKFLGKGSTYAAAGMQALQAAATAIMKAIAQDYVGATLALIEAAIKAIGFVVVYLLELDKADRDNEQLQVQLELHLDKILSTFWGWTEGMGKYLSGYRLGIVDTYKPGMAWYGYATGESRGYSMLMRNFVHTHGGILHSGICNYQLYPQIPLFMRGIGFGVIASVTPDDLYGVQPVWGNVIPVGRQKDKPSDIPMNAKGPVGFRVFEMNRKSGNIKFTFGKGAETEFTILEQFPMGIPGKAKIDAFQTRFF